MLGSKLANSDVGRTQCSNRICLQESATPLDTNFDALKLVLASQLGPVSIEFDPRKGRSSRHVVSKPLGNTAFRTRCAANVRDPASGIVNNVHALTRWRIEFSSILRKRLEWGLQQLGE